MSLLVSILIGILAGYIACKLTGNESKGLLVNLFLGVIGGFVGGWLFDLLGIVTYSWVGTVISSIRSRTLRYGEWLRFRRRIRTKEPRFRNGFQLAQVQAQRL